MQIKRDQPLTLAGAPEHRTSGIVQPSVHLRRSNQPLRGVAMPFLAGLLKSYEIIVSRQRIQQLLLVFSYATLLVHFHTNRGIHLRDFRSSLCNLHLRDSSFSLPAPWKNKSATLRCLDAASCSRRTSCWSWCAACVFARLISSFTSLLHLLTSASYGSNSVWKERHSALTTWADPESSQC